MWGFACPIHCGSSGLPWLVSFSFVFCWGLDLPFASLILLRIHRAFVKDLGSQAVCLWMSSGLRVRLAELSKEADRLQTAVVDLAESLADMLKPGNFGDWVRVDDSCLPLSLQEFRALQALQRYQGLEDGYPPVLQGSGTNSQCFS